MQDDAPEMVTPGLWDGTGMAERFWPKVNRSGGADSCWIWTASTDGIYGQIGRPPRDAPRRMAKAHRVAYELCVGEIPPGLHLDHLCRNPICVNPAHLEPVTCRENLMRGNGRSAHHAAKTACDNGHPYVGENFYTRPNGHRRCRVCAREYAKRSARRKNT